MITIADLIIALRIDTSAFILLSIVLILSLLFTCQRVWRRLNSSHLLRISICSLNVIAVITFILLFTQISLHQSVNKQLNLITQSNTSMEVPIPTEDSFVLTPHSIMDLAAKLPNFSNVVVYGDGLSELQWQQLEQLTETQTLPAFSYAKEEERKANTLVGFAQADWQRELVLGQSLIINLELTKQEDDPNLYQAKLFDPSNTLIANETVRMGDSFTFETLPKSKGRWLYTLSLQSADDTEVVTERIYVNVKPGISPKVFVIQAAPSFETRHLQNWLSDMNASVRIETQISRDKFKRQSINVDAEIAAQRQQPLSEDSLQWPDLLIIDRRSVSQLSSMQLAAMEQAVENGLGVYLIADTGIHDVESPSLISAVQQGLIMLPETDKTALPNWLGFTARQPVEALNSRFTAGTNGLLVTDEFARGLVKATNRGAGTLATSLLSSTYKWRIGGDRQLHSRYWQLILTEVGRRKPNAQWEMHDFSLLDNATSQIKLCTLGASPQSEVFMQSEQGSQAIALELTQSAIIPNRSCVSFWQQHAGWHKLKTNDGDKTYVDHVFLYPANTWQVLNQSHRRSASLKRVVADRSDTPKAAEVAVPDWVIWVIWLLSMTLLWIEQRWFFNK